MKLSELIWISQKAIADDMGKELEIKNMDFDGAFGSGCKRKGRFLLQQVCLSMKTV